MHQHQLQDISMKRLFAIIVLCLGGIYPVLAAEEGNRIDSENENAISIAIDKAAYESLLGNYTTPLTEQSGCKQLLNYKGDQTIGQLMASFLAWPAEQPEHKYFIHSRCMADKQQVNKRLTDTHKCVLTVTEEAGEMEEERVHIIASLVFAVSKKDFRLIKDSLLCL